MPQQRNSNTNEADAASANTSHSAEGHARFVAAVEKTPLVAMQGFSRDGTIQVWNEASEALYGIPHDQAIGKRIQDLLMRGEVRIDFETELARIWDTGQASTPRDWQITTAAGKHVWVYSCMYPVVLNGKTQQVFCTDVDITVRKEDQEQLQASATKFRSFFEQSADAIILLRNGQFAEFNPAALRLFGYGDDASAMSGLEPVNVSPERQPDGSLSEQKMAEMTALALTKGNHRFEWQYRTRDDRVFWGEALLTAVHNDGETIVYAVVRDISRRKEDEHFLGLAAQVFESSRDAILISDADRRIVSVNRCFSAITGYTAQEVLGRDTQFLYADFYQPTFFTQVRDVIAHSDHWQGEIWGRRKDGSTFPAWVSMTGVRDMHGKLINHIGIFSDITERKRTEEHIRHMVEHDFLTGLPNRVLLLDRMHQALAAAKRNRSKLAVLFLDLDRFKDVNDSLGHQVGDKLLQAVAERLKKCVRGNDTVSRQGGDEFVIMLADIRGVEQVAHIAGNILKSIAQPYQIDEHALTISTCIGIAVFPGDGSDIDTLIKHADTAMYHAKEAGRNGYQFFNHDMNTRIVARITLENQLRRALLDEQFSLHYQPEIDIASGRVVGAEALIRWRHPEGGLLPPERFLSVAEECGLIVPIGDWVLNKACEQARAWHDMGLRVYVGVNLSAIQFRQKNFLDKIRHALERNGLPPHLLELEITESVLFDKTQASIDTMHALRKLGVRLAVDDFGSGYSSLSYLKHFPVDKLKIDRSFIHDLSTDANDAAIIRAILIMAKSLNLAVIAEGVETVDQLSFLRAQGCDEFQGNYVTAPVLPAELMHFLQPA